MDEILDDVAAIQRIPAIPVILQVLAKATGMGFLVVARVTADRWIACSVLDTIDFGLKAGDELPIATTLCQDVKNLRGSVVIDEVASDPVYASHHTPAIYGLQSYIAVPITLPDGSIFGTLCAIDPKPKKPSEALEMFRLFADLISFHLDASRELDQSRSDLTQANADLDNSRFDLATSQASLLDAENAAELREQFIAVLGHDLRNPLAAIEGGRRVLAGQVTDSKSERVLRLMSESVLRMSGLIDNVLDFARGRLGGGIHVDRSPDAKAETILAQVINEIKAAHPDRQIVTRFDITKPVAVDHARMAQMFSNLLGNAITHGTVSAPIVVTATTAADDFELTISNGGDPISPEAMKRLFQPFYRGEVRPSMQGLGLGLYIASQIAKAHGGMLEVHSDEEQTRFTFRMPLGR
ncbi:GAF domain-containing sensor histidine kinase [Devosia aurantiaca]|uniref:histidine kinase n=1 Tax=Devosia aurantiaca TaxID=2714858 RepID=A0A6M1STM2_9HYPH|nr:GAF domain-containing sensor histidine kinase [Devosia aurantiaca]NGP17743.1 GAF domain-containing sensor histidine kinase [Devosia aurantiaca]